MGILDNLFGKKKGKDKVEEKPKQSTETKTSKGFIDMRNHPLERKAIEDHVEETNRNLLGPKARLTISENGKADIWYSDRKWPIYNHQALELKNIGKYDEAIQKFNDAINDEPKAGIPHYGKAEVLLKLGDYEGALKECNTAITLDKATPEHPPGKDLLLDFYLRKIQILQRLCKYEEILDPEMGKYLMSSDPTDYKRISENAKKDLEFLNKIKNSKSVTSKAKIDAFNEQMEKVFNIVESANSVTKPDLTKLSTALVEVDKAILMNSKNTSAHVMKALIIIGLKNTGKRDSDIESARELSLAVALEPNNPHIFWTRGMITFVGGDEKFAKSEEVRANFLDPEYISKKKYQQYRPFVVCFQNKK